MGSLSTLPSEVIGSEECAQLLGCSVEQVEDMARAGDIPGVKIGRSWRFVRAGLLAYLDERGRAEAQERRAGRQPTAKPVKPPRRRAPPSLAFVRQE